MSKKLVKLLILVSTISIMLMGCSNTKEASPETGISREDIEDDFEVKKDILETISTDTKYENFKEFKTESKNNAVKFSNGHVNISIMIPVKAEGLTKYYLQYQDGKYVLDDGTVVEEIDSRR